jgi:glycosyltransferase involved in cell wall biosynthesis
MRILILSSLTYSLVNFRGALLRSMVEAGHDVTAVGPDRDEDAELLLRAWGISLRHVPMSRTGTNPAGDLRLLWAYVSLIREVQPDIVLAYTQKPIVYGGIAARLAGRARFFALMSGLGHAFSPDAAVAGWLRKLICLLYREGVRKARAIFVFNSADRQDMLDLGIIDESQRVVQVPGSGVDVERFAARPLPEQPHFLMVSRLMRNKGVMEFLEAARDVARTHPQVRFGILGRPDPQNPQGLGERECADLAARYPVRFLPPTTDVRPHLADCSAFVLPSYYREGLPRTILEAMATGRAIVTTNMPGCRDAVEDGRSGIVVPPRDPCALAAAMRRLLDDPQACAAMGARSRRLAEDIYDVRRVNAILFGEMGLSGAARLPGAVDQPTGYRAAAGLGLAR